MSEFCKHCGAGIGDHRREAVEAALLAPSPCPNGCRICDWVEADAVCENCGRGQSNHTYARTGHAVNGECNNFRGSNKNVIPGYCTRCAELERVRKLERAAAYVRCAERCRENWQETLKLEAEHPHFRGATTMYKYTEEKFREWAEAEDQAAPNPPPRIDGDVLTYAGFRWQRLPVPTVSGPEPAAIPILEASERLRVELSRVSERTKELREALHNLEGQVVQARDGFNIWPYNNSKSMQEALDAARAILKKSDPTI